MSDHMHLREYLLEHASSSGRVVTTKELQKDRDCRIVKSLIWEYGLNNDLVLVLLDLENNVNIAKLQNLLQLGTVRLAAATRAEQITQQTIGNISPIGHKGGAIRTIIDTKLFESKRSNSEGFVYGGGGTPGYELYVSIHELLRLSAGEIADISSDKTYKMRNRRTRNTLTLTALSPAHAPSNEATSTSSQEEEPVKEELPLAPTALKKLRELAISTGN